MSDLQRADRVVADADWERCAESHRRRADRLIALTRAEQPHPVWDFLFTYYGLRAGQLLCWHPGYGTVLAGARARRQYLGRTGYVGHPDGVTVGPAQLAKRIPTVRFIADLLTATAGRPAQLNCFGMHEWAMVYRAGEVRHRSVPLRLGAAGTDAVVASSALRCTHFDAFRFFTDEAAPRNTERLTRDSQRHHEQPGCLHANMDLFKWALKLSPLVPAGLLLDCFAVAGVARELDMRAGPYDLTGFGFTAIRVEEPAGRAEYARLQGEIAHRAAALRQELLRWCHILIRADSAAGSTHPGAADPPTPETALCRA